VPAFLDVLCTAIPNVVLAINNALADNELEAAYRVMPAVDLSRQVFAPQPHRLLMVRDVTSGWADLGSPSRVDGNPGPQQHSPSLVARGVQIATSPDSISIVHPKMVRGELSRRPQSAGKRAETMIGRNEVLERSTELFAQP